jgi:hypothetical protein
MLIALAAVAIASPILVNISATTDVSSSLLGMMTAEADAIWRPAGVTFRWQRAPPDVSPALHVIVDHERGAAHGAVEPLGWIVFDDLERPGHEIHISYANAISLLERSGSATGAISKMPRRQRETYLGRAMGRALAHEIGHYLLASKVHTERGLMRATRSAVEFFSTENRRFEVDPAERDLVAVRLGGGLRQASDQ